MIKLGPLYFFLIFGMSSTLMTTQAQTYSRAVSQSYDIAAFVWPSYHPDDRAKIFWPDGIGEWQTVISNEPKYEGHEQPRYPLWGYVNEADPYIAEMEIDAAADHGVNVFIFDWYWYDGMPYLEGHLNNGYLQARNKERVKFYLMWANHDVKMAWDKRNAGKPNDAVVWKGAVDREEFEVICHRVIGKYFSHPSYYTVDGKPSFMIYDLNKLIQGLGGVNETKAALEWFRQETVKAGFKGLDLQLTLRGKTRNVTGIDGDEIGTQKEVIEQLGLDGVTHYQFVHFINIDRDYNEIMDDVEVEWQSLDDEYDSPYYAHVSVGWDNNPRFQMFRPGVVKNNTPENFEKALRRAKNYVDERPDQAPLITINSWNEWTETSYLHPCTMFGYGYLEAVKKVFAPAPLHFEVKSLSMDSNEACEIADFNNDGILDISAGRNWYAGPDYVPRPLRNVGEFRTDYLENNGEHAIDVDGDGWLDIVSGSFIPTEVCWYKNPGKEALAKGRLWTRHILGETASQNELTYLRDFNGDGKPEYIANSWGKENEQLIWEIKPDGSNFTLQKSTIGSANGHGIGFGDINGDNREDILFQDGWYERPAGDPLTQTWTLHSDWDWKHSSCPMIVTDLNGDGRNDVIRGNGHNYGVFWMEQLPAKAGKTQWIQHVIDDSWSQAHALAWVDLDGDGNKELITGKRVRGHSGRDPGADEPAAIYCYTWDNKTKTFTRRTIAEGIGTGLFIRTADLNKDGKLDIVVSGKSGTYLLLNQ